MSSADHVQSLCDELGITRAEMRKLRPLELSILPAGESLDEVLSLIESGKSPTTLFLAPNNTIVRDTLDTIFDRASDGASVNYSKRRLSWKNGSRLFCFSAESPDLLRGLPLFDTLWIEDLSLIPNLSECLGALASRPSLSPRLILGVRFEERRSRAVPREESGSALRVEQAQPALRPTQASGHAPQERHGSELDASSCRGRLASGRDSLKIHQTSSLSPLVIGVALASAGLLAALVFRRRGHSLAALAADFTAPGGERGGTVSCTSSDSS